MGRHVAPEPEHGPSERDIARVRSGRVAASPRRGVRARLFFVDILLTDVVRLFVGKTSFVSPVVNPKPPSASTATQSVSPRVASTVATGMPAHRTRHATGAQSRRSSRVAGASGRDVAVSTVTAKGSMADAKPGGRNASFSFSFSFSFAVSVDASFTSSNASRLTVMVAHANPRSASGIGGADARKTSASSFTTERSEFGFSPNVAVAARRDPSITLASSTSTTETMGSPRE